jgi:superoxide dismutase, Cu-Zn family
MKYTTSIATSPFLFLALLGVACGGSQPAPEVAAPASEPAATAAESASAAPAEATVPAEAAPPAAPKTLTVAFIPKSGSKLVGKATLTEEATGVKLVLEIEGVSPGDHGAHVHESADCTAPDAKSAGGHYNPDKHEHALPDGKPRHLGDLGNIVVGKDGKGKLEIVIPDANLKSEDPHSFIGRGIIVHEKKDDGGQPVGNAGGRIGCASIVEKS